MIIVRAESIKESNHTVSFQITSTGLKNKVPTCMGLVGFYGTTVLEIGRATVADPNQFSKCYRSEP